MDFNAEQAREIHTTESLTIKYLIIDDFKENVWKNEKLDSDLVNILYDILLVAQTQCTNIVREMTISEENIEELKRLGFTVEKHEDNYYYISF